MKEHHYIKEVIILFCLMGLSNVSFAGVQIEQATFIEYVPGQECSYDITADVAHNVKMNETKNTVELRLEDLNIETITRVSNESKVDKRVFGKGKINYTCDAGLLDAPRQAIGYITGGNASLPINLDCSDVHAASNEHRVSMLDLLSNRVYNMVVAMSGLESNRVKTD